MKLYQRKENDSAPLGQADPYIFEWQGKYYVYATNYEGVQLYRADSLFGDWEYLGICFSMEGKKNYWAPSVLDIDGKIYMYVSNTDEGEEDQNQQNMKVAVADVPEGPFVYVKDLLPAFSIDSHIVRYKDGLYLFYSVNDTEAERAGTLVVLDRMTDPLHTEGHPVIVARATLDEEIFMKDRYRQGQHWHTIEGAFYFNEGNTHFVTYSGSCYGRPTYFVGYAVAHGDPDDLRELEWQKYPDDNTYYPILCANDFVEGTGHNSVIRVDGQWYIVYHGRDRKGEKANEDSRIMRADKLTVNGDVLSVEITP